ncbi:MAG: hypothetical protein ACYDHH_14745 [Solirubrobacteraceae bacterium]
MNIRTTAPTLIAPIAAVALLLAGCGSSSKTQAASTAPAPTATMVGSGTPPVAGSTGTSAARRAPTIATSEHYRAGDFCSGRDQARYAGKRLTCVTGRLKPTK